MSKLSFGRFHRRDCRFVLQLEVEFLSIELRFGFLQFSAGDFQLLLSHLLTGQSNQWLIGFDVRTRFDKDLVDSIAGDRIDLHNSVGRHQLALGPNLG